MHERPFVFSSFPGRLATPVFGAAAAVLVGVAGLWAIEGRRGAPAWLLVVGIAVLAVAARWLVRRGVLVLPLLREEGVNLEATRTGGATRVWLCAHLDSKSQPAPTLIRSAGIVLEACGLLMATLLAMVEAFTGAGAPEFYWVFAGVVTLAGALPVGLSMTGARSPGALDNASGVATILAAVGRLDGARGVGVLITDAEEMGLAGARAWAAGRTGAVVINVDGVDDSGAIAVMRSGAVSARLTNALRAAAPGVAVGPHFPGVLTDAVAFADAGMDSVTVSRGTIGSFLRVHSRRDNLGHLRGDGIAPTAEFVADTARHLLGEVA